MNHESKVSSTRCIPSTHRAICRCGYRGPKRFDRESAKFDADNHKTIFEFLAREEQNK